MRLQCIRIILAAFFLSFIALPGFAADQFNFDPAHSYVQWHIKHLGFSIQSGKWYIKSGYVRLDKDNPNNSQVEATIDINKLITGNPELNKHLKGKLFFDVQKYPIATFVSDKVDVTSDKTAKVHGILTVHGVSKPITLEVTLNKVDKNPINDLMTAGFTATTEINRSDFGINTMIPDVGDEVTIEIGAEANQPRL